MIQWSAAAPGGAGAAEGRGAPPNTLVTLKPP